MNQIHPHREINQRTHDGMTATLYWREGTMPPEWFVEVQDVKTDDYFIIDSLDNPNITPNEAYMHPFVYRLGNVAISQ